MAGPRFDRASDRGRRFAQELIDTAHAGARTWQESRIGPYGLRVGSRTDDALARLVLGAFLPGGAQPVRFSLAVARHGERLGLPPVEWAWDWIARGQPVAAEVTAPYRVFCDRTTGIAYALDTTDGRAAVWIRHERELDLRSFITPFRLMMSWFADTFGGEVVHASAAVVDGRAVAFSGASGSGKSTLAIGLGLSGHPMISDDCLLVHDGVAYAVFGRAKLDGEAERIVGARGLHLHSLPDTPRAKRFFAVTDLGAGFVGESPLHAWGFPVLGLGTGHFRMTPHRAYQELGADSLREVFGGDRSNRLRLVRLTHRYPAYRLLLGRSMAENVEVVRAALASGDVSDGSNGTTLPEVSRAG
jgi:hypothetical protein